MPRLNRKETQAATRERLLASARHIFLRDGYARANLDEIAERANYSKGAIYSNFANKEEIFIALLKRKIEGDIAAMAAIVARDQDTATLAMEMRAFVKAREDILDFTIVAVEFLTLASRSKHSAQACADIYRKQRKALSELVATFMKRTGQSTNGADAIAAGVVSITLGLAVQRGMDRKAIPLTLWSRVIEEYLAGVLLK